MIDLRDCLAAYLLIAPDIRSAPKLRHQINRWERFVTIVLPITSESVISFREQAIAARLSASTIETTISDIATILKSSGQPVPNMGRRLQKPRGNGQKQPLLSDVAKVYAIADHAAWPRRTKLPSGFCRQWSQADRTALFRGLIFLNIWTAFRLSDLTSLSWQHVTATTIEKKANKTDWTHLVPVVYEVQRHLNLLRSIGSDKLMPVKAGSRRFLRAELRRLCGLAGVPPFCPKQLRALAITEWGCTGTDAGRVAHGCGLGVLNSYYDGLKILERAAERFAIPPEMRDPDCAKSFESEISSLTQIAKRMDSSRLATLTRIAEAL
jgi:integrase